MVSIQTDFLSW